MADLFHYLSLADHWLAGVFPDFPRICLWGLSVGMLGLLLYAAASNQAEIGKLKQEARRCRGRLLDPRLDDADFARLTKRNLKVSLLLLARVSGPALLSALPILVVAVWMDALYPSGVLNNVKPVENLPEWLAGWEAPFFGSVFVAALSMKLALRLE